MTIDTKVLREPAPANSLPTWQECKLMVENAEFDRRAALGLEGAVLDTGPSPQPTALHRFIYEYDDANPHRSAWFLHRLEQVVNEAVSGRLAALEAENQVLKELLDCRAGRLLVRDEPFFVVKASEPYAQQVVDLIKQHEGERWTKEDEQWAEQALATGGGK